MTNEEQKQRTIEWLKSLMVETATLLRELENPAEKDARYEDAPDIEKEDTRCAQLAYDKSKAPQLWDMAIWPIYELPPDLRDLVRFCTLIGDWWHLGIIYVSTEMFYKFLEKVEKMNGTWVSAGKNSEFRIPNKKAKL